MRLETPLAVVATPRERRHLVALLADAAGRAARRDRRPLVGLDVRPQPVEVHEHPLLEHGLLRMHTGDHHSRRSPDVHGRRHLRRHSGVAAVDRGHAAHEEQLDGVPVELAHHRQCLEVPNGTGVVKQPLHGRMTPLGDEAIVLPDAR